MIVADDLGYGDLGAFEGEIETPNLDALAAAGARFTRFYTQASCSPTRSLLMTGVDNHLNGLGTMAEDHLAHQDGVPGYVGYLNDEVVTVAQLLQDAGYHTYMTGKWHLGMTPGRDPFRRGFESTWAILDGGGNHFNGDGMTTRRSTSRYTQNGEVIERPDGVYSSDLFTDKRIESIERGQGDGRPFFAYLAFTAPHFPLQAPVELIEKYTGRYADGWDATRRWSTTSTATLAGSWACSRSSASQTTRSWCSCPRTVLIPTIAIRGRSTPSTRSNGLANMGAGNSYIFYGLGWAQVGSVHHRHYKFLTSEGGMHAPMIARFPGVLVPGDDRDAFATALDVAPTFLELAGVEPPRTAYQGREIHPMRGRSLVPYMKDSRNVPYADDEPVAFEIFGHGVVFMGPWKAVRLRPP